jgi:hypothetical protein
VAIRSGEWKLHLNGLPAVANKKQADGKTKKSIEVDAPALFNVVTDPGESKNVADANAEVMKQLRETANKMLADIKAHQRPAGQAKDSQ